MFRRNAGTNLRRKARIEVTRLYVRGVATTRQLFVASLFLVLLGILFCFGLLLIHFGLYLALPIAATYKGLVFLGLGLVYLVLALLGIRRFASQELWMQASGAQALVDKVVGQSSERTTETSAAYHPQG